MRRDAAAVGVLAYFLTTPAIADVIRDAGAASPAGPTTRVSRQADSRGLAFFPSAPPAGAFRFALGALFDAIDPQVMYGVSARVPQVTLDAVGALGRGWSLRGHLNSMLVTTELLVGAGYAYPKPPWAFDLSLNVGVYVGRLDAFAIDAWFAAPQYRPELTVGCDFGELAVSLRGALLLMGPERVRVGEVWGGLDNSNVFVGHSEMLYVENPIRGGGAWYFGAGLLTTRAYYAFWLLFPDSPGLYSYPRVVAGYEF